MHRSWKTQTDLPWRTPGVCFTGTAGDEGRLERKHRGGRTPSETHTLLCPVSFLCCLHSHFSEVFLLKVYLSLWIVKCFIYLLSTVLGIKPRPSSLLAKLCTIKWHLNPSSLIYRVWVLVLRKGFFCFLTQRRIINRYLCTLGIFCYQVLCWE